ncbi:hypothetical protein GBAR_LOCUS19414, partial [Geodia barretti]
MMDGETSKRGKLPETSEVVEEVSSAPRTARKTEPSTAQDETEAQRQRQRLLVSRHCKKRLEFAFLVAMIVIVWGLFSLPIVFYYSSSSEIRTDNTTLFLNVSAKDNMTDECHIEYTGTQCMCALQSYAECESSEIETKVFISNTIGDQKAVENMVEDVVYFLGLITPSDECRSAAIQFFCLYFFGLCGTYNTDYRPTAAECREVRDSTCQSEWKEAERLLKLYGLSIELPKCSSLEDEGLDCDEAVSPNYTVELCNGTDTVNSSCMLECHEHFYCDNNFCKPRCDGFTIYSDEYVKLSDGLLITSGCVGLLCGIAVVVVFCIRRKKLMMFPTTLVFYMTISLLILEIFVLVSFLDRTALFCGSPDLAESLRTPTTFCTTSGIIEAYGILNVTLWWIFNICAIFWKVQFPFHARYYDQTNRTKYVHITCVVAAIILPLYAPLAIALKGGFIPSRFPPIICLGREVDANFYAVLAPITILLGIGTTMLLLILWRIRQVTRHTQIHYLSQCHIVENRGRCLVKPIPTFSLYPSYESKFL